MEPEGLVDTFVQCGVPVIRWRGNASSAAVRQSIRVLQTLAQHGYREAIIDLHEAVTRAESHLLLLQEMVQTLPVQLRVEMVLTTKEVPSFCTPRLHVAPSVAAAISHLTRTPIASLQASSVRYTYCQLVKDEE